MESFISLGKDTFTYLFPISIPLISFTCPIVPPAPALQCGTEVVLKLVPSSSRR